MENTTIVSPLMKKLLFLLVISSGFVRAQNIGIPPVTRQTLDNGLTIIVMEYAKVPLINFRLMVKNGSASDPIDLPGIASMVASTLREGTTTRSSTEISEMIDFMGGSLHSGAGLDYSAVSLEVMKKDLDEGLRLFADVVLEPSFPPEEIERERKQRLAEVDAIKERPSSIASLVFRRTAYGSHPYGNQTSGTRASLRAMTRADLISFYQKTFLPNNAVLVAVGDFEGPEILRKLEETFGPWQRGDLELSRPGNPVPLSGRKVVLVNKPDATQTQIRIGNTGTDIRNPDYFPLMVANTIFGSGFTSRLIDELRVKRSLTYGASSQFPSNLAGGLYSISTFTKNSTTSETVTVILQGIRKFRDEGASGKELEKARNYIAGRFARGLQRPETLASRLTDMELYGFPHDYLDNYIDQVKSVNLEDVARVTRTYFHLDDLLFVFVTPADITGEMIQNLGEVDLIELDDAVH